MKHIWDVEELATHWSLSFEEMQLLKSKPARSHLPLVAQLKYYRYLGRFPASAGDIPPTVLHYLADQVSADANQVKSYDWSGRTSTRHRREILQFLGVRRVSAEDKAHFSTWLIEHAYPTGSDISDAHEHAFEWFRCRKIECPVEGQLDRLARSAYQRFESKLFNKLSTQFSPACCRRLDTSLDFEDEEAEFSKIKADPGRVGLDSVLKETAKLAFINAIELPEDALHGIHPKVLHRYRQRIQSESAWDVKRHPEPIRHALLSIFLFHRRREIIDGLVDLLTQIVHRMSVRADRKLVRELIGDYRKIHGKTALLFRIAEAALENPDGRVRDVIFPVLDALQWLVRNRDNGHRYITLTPDIPVEGVIRPKWRDIVVEENDGKPRINRINYEICLLQALRDGLRCKEIWVVHADRYRNPDDDLPRDFDQNREDYYQDLGCTADAVEFTDNLKEEMQQALADLNKKAPRDRKVRILSQGKNRISITPFDPVPDPPNLTHLKREVSTRWPMTGLLDVLKEADLRIGFTRHFQSVADRQVVDESDLQKRLLLCLYGMGTNTGLKRISGSRHGISYKELLTARRKYVHKAALQNSIAQVANAIFAARNPTIWGEGTTACASDSKKFGAWDQNLMTEWHIRYGGRGVMIYWHVEKNSTCIYSQLKRCSSSEVAAMIEGVLRHCTDMEIQRQYVDSHGQSEVAFAFCHLLGFDLLPRLKAIGKQKLYRPGGDKPGGYANLEPILTRPINWDLIVQQYDEMVKYATALKQGTADPESILRRFTRNNVQHPTYRALAELGKTIKTLFLCRYLESEPLRQEINDGLNVVENWNSANSFIFFGKGGEVATNRLEDQELSVLALHLLQICMVYVNTLMIQQVLDEPEWFKRMKLEDLRALTPLIYAHINPYGIFELDMDERLPLKVAPG